MSVTNLRRTEAASSEDPEDDVGAYIASLSAEEQKGVAIAGVAYDLAILAHRTEESSTSTTQPSTDLSEFRQRVMSGFARDGAMPQIGELQAYLRELGYVLELHLIDIDTDRSALRLVPPAEDLTPAP